MILRALLRLGLSGLAVFVLLPASIFGLAILTGLRTGMVAPEFILLCTAAAAFVCAAIARLTGSPVLGRRVALGASVATALIVLKFSLPGVFSRIAGAANRLDERARIAEKVAATPEVVPCTEPFFIGPEGINQYWFSLDDEQPRCYNRAGRDPRTGRKLDAMDHVVADYIRLRAEHAALRDQVKRTAESIRTVTVPQPLVATVEEPVPPPIPSAALPAEPVRTEPSWSAPRVPDRLPAAQPPR